MSNAVSENLQAFDRIKLPLTFDVESIREDIQGLNLREFQYYDVITLRSPAFMVDSTIEQPVPAKDYADGTWTEWLDTPALKNSPALSRVVDTFSEHTRVTLVRLIRLEPGGVVDEHVDPTLGLHVEKSVIRLTVPIFSDDAVEFYLNDTLVPMQPGECWYMRLTDPHRVVNSSAGERINMTIDMQPNEWVYSQLRR